MRPGSYWSFGTQPYMPPEAYLKSAHGGAADLVTNVKAYEMLQGDGFALCRTSVLALHAPYQVAKGKHPYRVALQY